MSHPMQGGVPILGGGPVQIPLAGFVPIGPNGQPGPLPIQIVGQPFQLPALVAQLAVGLIQADAVSGDAETTREDFNAYVTDAAELYFAAEAEVRRRLEIQQQLAQASGGAA